MILERKELKTGGDRILMTADAIGGVWSYAVTLCKELAKRDVQVGLATMGRALTADQRRELDGLRNVVLFESEYRLEWMRDPWDDLHCAGEWLKDVAHDFRPELVHVNHYAHSHLFEQPTLVVAHSDVVTWWNAVHCQDPPGEWQDYRTVVRRGLAAADFVLAPSRSMLKSLMRHYPINCRADALPNAIADQGRAVTLKDKEPFVLSVGRLWDEAKNIATLGRIAPDVDRDVYVAGADKAPDGQAAQMEGIKPLGFLDPAELKDWYRRAGVYALPAYYEPFGLSALEAASHGCALVLGDIPSLRENWQDAAWFVPPNDPARLCEALNRLLNDRDQREELGQRALDRSKRFTPQRQAIGYLNVYRRMGASFVAR
ncbi:MAG: glycosyltransferase family 4 protein [Fimbriimonadaceae bacterium]